jgi:hypothetical protein
MTEQGALKLGLQLEDFDQHLLTKMYVHYNATGEDPTNTEKQEAVEDDDDNKDDDDTSTNKTNDGDGGANKKSTANNAECPKQWTFTR